MSDDFVTSGEFGRWRSDFQAFQERLDERLDRGFSGVNHRLDDLNGRTRKNSEAIVSLDQRIDSIRNGGCGQLRAHQKLLGTDAPKARWRDRRVWFGGGVGAALIAAMYEMAKAIQTVWSGHATP